MPAISMEDRKETILKARIVAIEDRLLLKVVDVHLDAFKGFMNARMGKGYVRAFIRWFSQNDQCIAIAAEGPNGAVQGYVVGAQIGYQNQLNRDLFPVVFCSLLLRPWLVLNKAFFKNLYYRTLIVLGKKEKIQEVQTEDTLVWGKVISLVGIGVAGTARGSGVAGALVEEFERKAQAAGFQFMRLSVHTVNAGARKFYEKQGWKLIPGGQSEVVYYYKPLKHESDKVL